MVVQIYCAKKCMMLMLLYNFCSKMNKQVVDLNNEMLYEQAGPLC